MKSLFIVLMMFASIAFAGKPNWQDPNATYNAKDNMVNRTTVTLRHVDDIQSVCETESKRRGLGGFGFGVDACTFWEGNTCTVILPKRFTKEMLGHEMLHCIQGSFH